MSLTGEEEVGVEFRKGQRPKRSCPPAFLLSSFCDIQIKLLDSDQLQPSVKTPTRVRNLCEACVSIFKAGLWF